jgi:hypothetical protein
MFPLKYITRKPQNENKRLAQSLARPTIAQSRLFASVFGGRVAPPSCKKPCAPARDVIFLFINTSRLSNTPAARLTHFRAEISDRAVFYRSDDYKGTKTISDYQSRMRINHIEWTGKQKEHTRCARPCRFVNHLTVSAEHSANFYHGS